MAARLASFFLATQLCTTTVSTASGLTFVLSDHYLNPPSGTTTIGDSHGDIAISPAGDIYVSVQGGAHPGVQVYSPKGRYLRNVPNAPTDLHGFVIATAPDGSPCIFGASLSGEQIIRLTLSGKVVLTISAEPIPDKYKTFRDGRLSVSLTGVAVAPNGDIYAVDGYGRDFIHRFDKFGRYLSTFGGSGKPWNFKQCHKIALDTRHQPARLLCADRLHNRLVQMDLDGNALGTLATGLRWPSAIAVFHNQIAVAELGGRISILGINGETIAVLGSNENTDQTKTNKTSPEVWRSDVFYAPHGITYDSSGNLLVTEWSEWGRIIKASRR